MIKKQQKWIALLVTCTFIWLLQVSTMPVAAAGAPEQISAASTEQAPDFIEEEDDGGYQAKKSSILPIVLIGVGVAAAAAVLFLVVLKTSYDITGTWTVTDTVINDPTTIVFSGSKKSGTLDLTDFLDTGTYTVDGKKVHFEFNTPGHNYNFVFDGQFDSKDKMSGTMKYYWNGAVDAEGTWTGTRIATATGSGKLSTAMRSARKPQ
jgi:hypothetical protein